MGCDDNFLIHLQGMWWYFPGPLAGKGKKAAEAGAGAAEADKMDVSRLDFRIGKIVAVEKHPDADTLYVETVDLGEEKPRTIVSGLVNHVPIEQVNRCGETLCHRVRSHQPCPHWAGKQVQRNLVPSCRVSSTMAPLNR